MVPLNLPHKIIRGLRGKIIPPWVLVNIMKITILGTTMGSQTTEEVHTIIVIMDIDTLVLKNIAVPLVRGAPPLTGIITVVRMSMTASDPLPGGPLLHPSPITVTIETTVTITTNQITVACSKGQIPHPIPGTLRVPPQCLKLVLKGAIMVGPRPMRVKTPDVIHIIPVPLVAVIPPLPITPHNLLVILM